MELLLLLLLFGAVSCASFVRRIITKCPGSSSFSRTFSSDSRSEASSDYSYHAGLVDPWREADRRNRKHMLRITTYNAERLVNPNAVEEKKVHPTTPYPDATAALQKLDCIAERLAPLDSDVIVLQEVQDLVTLDLLRKRLPRGYLYDAHLIANPTDPFMMNVGVLTRISPKGQVTTLKEALEETPGYVDDPKRRSCRSIICNLPLGNEKLLCLIGVHLSSFCSKAEESRERRLLEAKQIRQQVWKAKYEDKLVVVAGDFNDVDKEAPGVVQPYYTNPRVVTEIKGLDLYNAASLDLLSKNQRFSTKKKYLIDHLLSDKELLPETFSIANSVEIDVSDHYPVTGTYYIRPRKT